MATTCSMEFSHPGPCLHSQAHRGGGLVCVLHERSARHGSVAGLRSKKTTDALKDIEILITAYYNPDITG